MILDTKSNDYSRLNSIIYQNSVPIIELKQKFIDIEKLSQTALKYLNRYMEMYPELYEIIEDLY